MLNFGYSSGEKDTKLYIRIGISLTWVTVLGLEQIETI